MQEFTLDTLAQRINRLECEVRRWRLGTTILLICAVAVLVMGSTLLPKAQVLEARRFILKGPDGKVHAILGLHRADADAPSSITGGTILNYQEAFGGAWGLHIFGSDGKYRAGFMSSDLEGGGGYLTLVDKDATSRASLHVNSGLADFSLSATKQSREAWERQWEEYVNRNNTANTEAEKEKALLSEPPPDLSARLLLSSKGHAAFTLSEKDGSDVVLGRVKVAKLHGVVEQRPLSSLVFRDKDGDVFWKAP